MKYINEYKCPIYFSKLFQSSHAITFYIQTNILKRYHQFYATRADNRRLLPVQARDGVITGYQARG